MAGPKATKGRNTAKSDIDNVPTNNPRGGRARPPPNQPNDEEDNDPISTRGSLQRVHTRLNPIDANVQDIRDKQADVHARLDAIVQNQAQANSRFDDLISRLDRMERGNGNRSRNNSNGNGDGNNSRDRQLFPHPSIINDPRAQRQDFHSPYIVQLYGYDLREMMPRGQQGAAQDPPADDDDEQDPGQTVVAGHLQPRRDSALEARPLQAAPPSGYAGSSLRDAGPATRGAKLAGGGRKKKAEVASAGEDGDAGLQGRSARLEDSALPGISAATSRSDNQGVADYKGPGSYEINRRRREDAGLHEADSTARGSRTDRAARAEVEYEPMVKIEQNDGHGNRTAGEHPSSSSSPTQHHPSTADHLIAAVEAAPESSSRKASRASARTYEYQPVETSTQTLGLDKRPEDQPHLIIDEVGGRRTTRRSVAAPGAYTAASRIAATPAPPAVPAAALSRAQTVAPSSKPRQQRQASAAPTPAPARPSSSAPTSDSNVRQQRAATAVPSPAPGSNNATLKNTKRKFSPGKVPETIDEEHSEADSQDLDLGPRKRARQGSVGRGMVEELKKKVSEEEAAGVEQGEVVEEEIEQQQQQQDEMEEEEMDEQLLLQMGEEEMEQLQQEMKGKEVDQQLLQQMGEEEIDDDEEEYDSDTIEVKPRVKGTEPAKKAKGDGKGQKSSSTSWFDFPKGLR